ncbi:inosine 5'-monophosphate dehydrogenase [Pseudobythopirellula maris]|uniref:Inosine 5'-monophosphate dehydrogenase n=1 Tax=Pseudobythopirellula maris TaxID=2527991 RepID=A0A5C5ZMF4_9BACT|nr:CBS domain-containing protein [Pseudobythopirellula maris]TWT88654.1 inosine 5'-monophosphate dehydrogenase [Pseudobythopirellula maris]
MQSITARDFMVKKLVTLRPEMDVFQAIDLLLKNRISGAPVCGDRGQYLGIFSEHCSMHVLLDAAYEQLPATNVGSFMDADAETIKPDTQLLSVAQVFLLTNRRRLPVVDEQGQLLGQVSRRDVLAAAMKGIKSQPVRTPSLLYLSALIERNNSPIS